MELLLQVSWMPMKQVWPTPKSFSEDIGHSLVLEWRKTVWNVQLQARRKMGPASQSNDWSIRTEWSSRIPRHKCAQPRNIEAKATNYDSHHHGLRKHWVMRKSAQYLRNSVKLVCRLFWKHARSGIYWSEYVHFRRKMTSITTAGSARSWFFGKKLAQDTRSRGKLLSRSLIRSKWWLQKNNFAL